MICTLKNCVGCIYGYITWLLVNDKGIRDKFGEYIYIDELWIHENYRGTQAINELIQLIHEQPDAIPGIWVYWKRDKYNRLTKNSYLRARLAKRGQLVEVGQ